MKNTIPEVDTYIDEVKRQAARDKRLTTAVEWLAEGIPRNWKYVRDWR